MTHPITKLFTAASLAVLTLSPALVSADDWPAWRGLRGTGISAEANWSVKWPAKGPARLWTAKLGQSYSSVAVLDGKLYTMGEAAGKDVVYCFDAANGAKLWTYAYAHPKRTSQADPNPTSTNSTPVASGDQLYTVSREGLALCINRRTGALMWKHNLSNGKAASIPQFGFSGSPLVVGNKVYYNAGSHGAALDRLSGKIIWSSGAPAAGYSTPVILKVDGKPALALFNSEGFVGADPETGKRLWYHAWKTQYNVYAVEPIGVDGDIYLMCYDAAKIVNITNGRVNVKWEKRAIRSTCVNPVLLGDCLYGNDRGMLKCVDFKTGSEKWSQRGLGEGTVISAGGRLIALTDQGELVVSEARPDRYVELARAKVIPEKCWTNPVLANGRLYCRNNSGDLVCLDLR